MLVVARVVAAEWRRLARKREREPVAARVQACIGKDIEQGMPLKRKTITVRLNAFLFFEGIERNLAESDRRIRHHSVKTSLDGPANLR